MRGRGAKTNWLRIWVIIAVTQVLVGFLRRQSAPEQTAVKTNRAVTLGMFFYFCPNGFHILEKTLSCNNKHHADNTRKQGSIAYEFVSNAGLVPKSRYDTFCKTSQPQPGTTCFGDDSLRCANTTISWIDCIGYHMANQSTFVSLIGH